MQGTIWSGSRFEKALNKLLSEASSVMLAEVPKYEFKSGQQVMYFEQELWNIDGPIKNR